MVEFVRSIEWPQNCLHLNLLDYHIWNEGKKLVYKIWWELFQYCSYCNENLKIYGLLNHKITSDQPLPKVQGGFKMNQGSGGPKQH